MYPEYIVAPMRAELVDAGFTELRTVDAVEGALKQSGTTLVVVNSVCGCAAGSARPGIRHSLANTTAKPDHLVTVFAGVDDEATKKVREHLLPYPPSSPAIALFKDGRLEHMIERTHIEGRSAAMIAANLQLAYEQYCKQPTVA